MEKIISIFIFLIIIIDLQIKESRAEKHLRTHSNTTVNASFIIIPGNNAALVELIVGGDYSQAKVILSQNNVSQTISKPIQNTGIRSLSFVFETLSNYVDIEAVVQVQDKTGSWSTVPSNTMFSVYPSPWVTPSITNQLYYIPPGTRSTNIGNSQV